MPHRDTLLDHTDFFNPLEGEISGGQPYVTRLHALKQENEIKTTG